MVNKCDYEAGNRSVTQLNLRKGRVKAMKKIAIGGGQGFWGDSPDAALHMLRHADIQYMACDYLAELTMSKIGRASCRERVTTPV